MSKARIVSGVILLMAFAAGFAVAAPEKVYKDGTLLGTQSWGRARPEQAADPLAATWMAFSWV